MEFITELKKARIKFIIIIAGEVSGPSLTIGFNGGFQWVGNPSHLSSTLLQVFSHISGKMASTEFENSISASSTAAISCYPGGVPRK